MSTADPKADGYLGIWYMNQPTDDEYRFKYSGGLGTYCAKHQPFAVYCSEVEKTFFCYGGTTPGSYRHYGNPPQPGEVDGPGPGKLLHMVSCYDHRTGTVPRPTLLLDKQTADAHDNPVIAVDDEGTVWVFSTSHGTSRPSAVHRSRTPYNIDAFDRVDATRLEGGNRVPFDNFSYLQPWYIPGQGFSCFLTHYGDPADRTLFFLTSSDGASWSEWTRLAAIERGHYEVSAANGAKAATAFNVHPAPEGLNWRSNLYYIETVDRGATWQAADGTPLQLPLTNRRNAALVHDTHAESRLVYLKDIRFDAQGHPVILYLTASSYACGPPGGPRTWTIAAWTGNRWEVRPAMGSDNNYDTGSLYLEEDGTWQIIGPTQPGPQPGNPGGEVAMWTSTDQGRAWRMTGQLTANSERNHTYVRRPVNAHPDFYALWADGDARKPSVSHLYFCDKAGNVRVLPPKMETECAQPALLGPAVP